MTVPIIDITSLRDPEGDHLQVARQLTSACRHHGFFYVSGHGVSPALQQRLMDLSWSFFNQGPAQKQKINMKQGGRAWRGYFAVGDELTSGKPDVKEGLYFGQELPDDHPLVKARTPMHGSNLFPEIAGFRETVGEYLHLMTELGQVIMRGIALSLQLPSDYFQQRFLKDPLILFRIFHYPAPSTEQRRQQLWGAGEHTDYGVLTILKQDEVGGLQIKSQHKWIDAPYQPDTFICNIGDMLDRLTAGYYRSTPHRVLNKTDQGRLSFPFFFDPNYHSEVAALDLSHLSNWKSMSYTRWDETDLHTLSGTYGQYLLQKVSKVFPQLVDELP